MTENPIDMSLVYKRKTTLRTKPSQRSIVEYSTVMNSIGSKTRTNMSLAESYISTCNNHNYANENYDKCINILEAVKDVNPSEFNKLENIFINNVIPHIEDLSSLTYRLSESSLLSYLAPVVDKYKVADRIINNYDKINSRSNIDYIFAENTDIMEKCYRISDIINNYNMGINNKMSIALETCMYGLYKNSIDYNISEVLENVLDYFLSVNESISDYDMNKIKTALDNSIVLSNESCKDLLFLQEDHNHDTKLLKDIENNIKEKEAKALIKEIEKVKTKKEAHNILYKVERLFSGSYIVGVSISFVTVTLIVNAIIVMAYIVGISPAILLNKLVDIIESGVNAHKADKDEYKRYKQVVNYIKKNQTIKESIEDEEGYSIYLTESEDYADSNDMKKALDLYKQDQSKDLSKFKRIITKFYSKSPTQVIDETPHILGWIRLGFVFSTAAYNPIITVPLFIVDQFIAMGFKRKEAERMVKIFNKERDKAERRSYTVMNSEKIDKYVKCLDTCIYKLEDYRDSLYSERELEKRDELGECANNENYQVTLDEVNISLTSIRNDIRKIEKQLSGNRAVDINESVLYEFYNTDNILSFVNNEGFLEVPVFTFGENYDVACTFADRLSNTLPAEYIALIENVENSYNINIVNKNHILLNESEQESFDNCIPYSLRKELDNISNISDNINYINSLNPMNINKEIKENFNILMECPEMTCRYIRNCKDIVDMKEFYHLLECYRDNLDNFDYIRNTEINFATELLLKESADLGPSVNLIMEAQSIEGLRNIIHEGINTTAMKTACLNMKKKVVNLSAKEKQLSQNLDRQVDVFSRKMKEVMISNKRESIIKGSIIPSFSKIIKLSLVAGATYLVAPTVAVIGSIGALACSKALTVKERKALLEEIDIELKVVEKQIAKAENNDDMNKYRHYLTYQRKLEREKMRIQYKLGPRGQVPTTALAHVDDDD